MGELTLLDIKKAIRQIEKYHGPSEINIYCSESMAKSIVEKAKRFGVHAVKDGKDYVLGRKIVTHADIDMNTCYITGDDVNEQGRPD